MDELTRDNDTVNSFLVPCDAHGAMIKAKTIHYAIQVKRPKVVSALPIPGRLALAAPGSRRRQESGNKMRCNPSTECVANRPKRL